MEWNRQNTGRLILVVCVGVAAFCVLQHLGTVISAVGWLLNALAPFLLGGAIAFILNVPMRAIERDLFAGKKIVEAFQRPLALMLTVASVCVVVALASNVIVPGVAEAMLLLVDHTM